ncbi:MAG TPA: hypothetical protein VIJ22_05325 [Polyangiaceae bacterium]
MNKPSWWTLQDSSSWDRVREALHRDWDQTKHDLHAGGHELNQKLSDTVEQAAGKKPMPPIDKANPPKVIGQWEDAETAIGYGYAARDHFGEQHPQWNDDLERRLAADWNTERPWSEVVRYVRHGYEVKR